MRIRWVLERLSDAEILDRARAENRVVITFDLDFGDLRTARRDLLPSVIMLRLSDQRPVSATPRVIEAISRFERDLSTGALLVVEDTRCRMRRLPLK
jgi:predicted nuclease of predicted toxin-antitoxin system